MWPSFSTPEEAARAVLGDKSARFVGVVVRGDEAVVAHWVSGYGGSGDTETTTCYRDPEGWEAAFSGNGSGGRILMAEDRMTFVWWGRAAPGATAVRVALGDQEKTVAVEDGFFFVVFDDVPHQEPQRIGPGKGYPWGYVRSGKRTPEERRAFFGFEPPRVCEWLFADAPPPD